MKLTKLVRKTIECALNNERFEVDEDTKKTYGKERACFVTLDKGGELRGCIGCFDSTKPLWKCVQENAINAAFHDPRFPPLSKKELEEIKIEVSVLSSPRKLEYKNPKNLLKKINRKMGIILKKNFHGATFLPQVWKQIPDKREFLEHLSLKAGLDKDGWKTSEFLYYYVDVEKE